MAKDPVCGMEVNEKAVKFKAEHMGKSYYFCSAMCKEKFEKNPSEYAKA
ncbi:TPA: YHS domain-containing protein [Candidatus Bathyarchaeota archaeon]|nr:YHS domain-containing protein [Candidatus Bathyarchaeota archaeon]